MTGIATTHHPNRRRWPAAPMAAGALLLLTATAAQAQWVHSERKDQEGRGVSQTQQRSGARSNQQGTGASANQQSSGQQSQQQRGPSGREMRERLEQNLSAPARTPVDEPGRASAGGPAERTRDRDLSGQIDNLAEFSGETRRELIDNKAAWDKSEGDWAATPERTWTQLGADLIQGGTAALSTGGAVLSRVEEVSSAAGYFHRSAARSGPYFNIWPNTTGQTLGRFSRGVGKASLVISAGLEIGYASKAIYDTFTQGPGAVIEGQRQGEYGLVQEGWRHLTDWGGYWGGEAYERVTAAFE